MNESDGSGHAMAGSDSDNDSDHVSDDDEYDDYEQDGSVIDDDGNDIGRYYRSKSVSLRAARGAGNAISWAQPFVWSVPQREGLRLCIKVMTARVGAGGECIGVARVPLLDMPPGRATGYRL